MLFCKLLGALLLTLAGISGAVLLNRAASRRIDAVEGWIALIRTTKNRIDCFALPLPEILRRCDEGILAAIGWQGDEPPVDFRALREVLTTGLLSEEGIRIADGFLGEIGKGYRAEQLRTCDYGIGLFSAERDRLLAALPKERSRNVALSMAMALGAVVLLL